MIHLSVVPGAAVAVVVLAGASTLAVGGASGGFDGPAFRQAPAASCAAPDLAGSVVDVSLVDMGRMGTGSMMGGGSGSSGPMRLLSSPTTVAPGTVSFRVHDVGTQVHELVVLPLTAGRRVGDRVVGAVDRVDEAGSVGEASSTCGPGPGSGIAAGSTGWVTLTLAPGSYELVCNLAGHYRAGMYGALIVR